MKYSMKSALNKAYFRANKIWINKKLIVKKKKVKKLSRNNPKMSEIYTFKLKDKKNSDLSSRFVLLILEFFNSNQKRSWVKNGF